MFYVNDEPEGKFLYTETIKLYCKIQLLTQVSLSLSVMNYQVLNLLWPGHLGQSWVFGLLDKEGNWFLITNNAVIELF